MMATLKTGYQKLLIGLNRFTAYNKKENTMKKRYTPNKKYIADSKSFDKLDATIKEVVKHDDKLRFEYEEERLNLLIAGTVYQLRTDAGLTQMQLAKKVGIPQTFISRIENPESKKRTTLDTLAKVIHAFDKQIMIEIV